MAPGSGAGGQALQECTSCGSIYDGGEHRPKQLPCGCVLCRKCLLNNLGTEGTNSSSGGAFQPRCCYLHEPTVEMRALRPDGVEAYVDKLKTLPAGDAEQRTARQAEELDLVGRLDPSWIADIGPCIGGSEGRAVVRCAKLQRPGEQPVDVAVKELPMAGSYRDRVVREVGRSMLASKECPAVCRVYGYMEQQGMVYLVMELCQTSLGRWLDNNGGKGMEMRQLAKVALDICTSLAQLHACGIVHCDIKPENCLVRGDGTVVLCDFGSSKVLEKTVMSTLAFTLAYSCLEQLSTRAGPGCRADPRWDVYSVAATLAELATGKKPFADTPSAMVAVEHAMGRTLQHMNLDQVPDDKLREILRQCLGPISSRPSLAGLQSMLKEWASA